MKATKLLATLLTASILFTGCGLKDQKAVITINDHAITQKDFDVLMDKAVAGSPLSAMMGNYKENKDGMLYLMTAQRVLNQLIVQELLTQEADERGIKVTNKDIDEAVESIMDKVGGKEQLANILKQNGISISDFKKDLKSQVRFKKLALAAGNIKVTDKDCEEFYKKNPDKFKNPEQVRASHILISANPYQIQQELTKDGGKKIEEKELIAQVDKKMAEKKALADKLAKELKADNSKFAAYAKKYSQDPGSAIKGGDLGFFDKDRMVPEFSKVAFSAKPNTISDPVQSQFGYHIIMVTDRRAAGSVPYAKAKSDIKEFLTAEKQIKTLDGLTEAAKKKAKIEYASKDYDPADIEKRLNKQLGGLKEQVMGVEANKKQETPSSNKKQKTPAKTNK